MPPLFRFTDRFWTIISLYDETLAAAGDSGRVEYDGRGGHRGGPDRAGEEGASGHDRRGAAERRRRRHGDDEPGRGGQPRPQADAARDGREHLRGRLREVAPRPGRRSQQARRPRRRPAAIAARSAASSGCARSTRWWSTSSGTQPSMLLVRGAYKPPKPERSKARSDRVRSSRPRTGLTLFGAGGFGKFREPVR